MSQGSGPDPDWFFQLRAGFLGVVAIVALSSCAYAPVAVEGLRTVPEQGAERTENPWIFVPARAWITRDTVTPVSVGMCDGESCPSKIAVAVIDVQGAEARTLNRALRDPSSLVRRLVEGNQRRIALVSTANRSVSPAIAARRMPRRIAAETRRLRHKGFAGFSMTIRSTEGPARIAHAAVLGRNRGSRLRVVVVIGERPGQAETAAKAAADANF